MSKKKLMDIGLEAFGTHKFLLLYREKILALIKKEKWNAFDKVVYEDILHDWNNKEWKYIPTDILHEE